jgi:hypothetical protein
MAFAVLGLYFSLPLASGFAGALGIDVGRRVHQGEGVLLAEREDRDR